MIEFLPALLFKTEGPMRPVKSRPHPHLKLTAVVEEEALIYLIISTRVKPIQSMKSVFCLFGGVFVFVFLLLYPQCVAWYVSGVH